MNVNTDLIRTAAASAARVADDAAPAVAERGTGLAEWATAAAATGSAFDAITGAGVKPFGAFRSAWGGEAVIKEARAKPILKGIDDALLGVRMARQSLPKPPVGREAVGDPLVPVRKFDELATKAEDSLSALQEYVRRGTRAKVSTYANELQGNAVSAVSKLHEATSSQARLVEHDETARGVDVIVREVRGELDRLGLSKPLPHQAEVDRAADRMLGRGGGRA